ncbi:hypothetical protein [Nocardia brasiliensis]|uniref:hypothetical protein n=1 Tax=Nocardia brasiliensis TaxID=37326 RepID=UPI003D91B33F
MQPSLRVVGEEHAVLMKELEALRARPIDEVFDGKGNVSLQVPTVVELAEQKYPGLWDAGVVQRIDAFTHLLRQALAAVPTDMLSGAPESSMTYRWAAFILYDINVPDDLRKYISRTYPKPDQWYAKAALYVRESIGIPDGPRGADKFKRVSREIRLYMAQALLPLTEKEAAVAQPQDRSASAEVSSASQIDVSEISTPTTSFKLDIPDNNGTIVVGNGTVINQSPGRIMRAVRSVKRR